MNNEAEIAYAQVRYDLEHHVQDYVRREVNCPWLRVTANPLTEMLEVWYEQPGRKPYLACRKPFLGDMQVDHLIQHLRAIDSGSTGETLAQKVERMELENQRIEQEARAAYVDRQMENAERVYGEVLKAMTGQRRVHVY